MTELLAELRRIGWCDHAALDAATRSLSDREKSFLADKLTQAAVHIATGIGCSRGLPPPNTLPGAGTDRIDLTASFVTVIEECGLDHPTRMTLRLRAMSAARLVVELHDSAENAEFIAGSGTLITEYVERASIRCGQHYTGARTVLWSELSRPELGRWA
ncbi:hypothetical protein [Nocardia wallacei]|uniref:hypothetical protein n=1 Tax=Nocardia wallacei TaxID=480035 RepID=UPI0024537609|nr:hypothetical protein [Nocardia wallacei]